MSDVEIKYNNKRVPVSGFGPTPYLSLSDEVINYGNRWGIAHRITLNGVITGVDYSALYTAQTGLVDIFASSYKTLIVYEGPDGATGYYGGTNGSAGSAGSAGSSALYSGAYSFSGCSVERVVFDNAPYNKVVPYTVELVSYPSGLTGYFSGTYGVLNPRDEIRISEGQDGFGTINHSVAASAFVTTSIDNAINNAKNYVYSRTGISNIVNLPQASGIDTSGVFTPVLVSISENLDRLALNYSVEEVYSFKLFTGDTEANNGYNFNNYYLTSYSTSLSSGAGDDFVTATIQGEIKAGITGSTGDALVTELVSQLSGLNPYAVISGKYGEPNGFKFCKDPIQISLSEDLKSRKISFNASYDNLEFYTSVNDKFVYGGCYLDAQIEHSLDNLSNISTIQVRGEIKARGSSTRRYNDTLNYLEKLVTAGSSGSEPRIYDFVNDYYVSYFGASPLFSLNATPVSMEINANPQLGTISINAAFDNKDRFLGLAVSDYSIDYSPYNTLYSYESSCNDSLKHLVVDMNVKRREKLSLNTTVASYGAQSSEILLLGNKDTIFTSLVNNFVKNLIASPSDLDTVQEESSNVTVSNSSSTNVLRTDLKYGSQISASKTFSFELKDSEIPNRIILKN
jgi:hypothetical protein